MDEPPKKVLRRVSRLGFDPGAEGRLSSPDGGRSAALEGVVGQVALAVGAVVGISGSHTLSAAATFGSAGLRPLR